MKTKLLLISVLMVVGAFLFYWFQIRSSGIRSQCDSIAWTETKERSRNVDFYDWKYTQCLHSKGLK
jgi:hypothetical protein